MESVNEIMTQVLLIASVIAPVTTALVQAIKKTGHISDNYLPLTALVIGVLLGFGASFLFTGVPMAYLIWAGGISGLAATGLFENFKQR
jgi:hypothetical protein